MGKRRRHRNRDAWWRQQYGGMPVWGIAVAVVFLVAMAAVAVPAALSQTERSEAAQPRPLPSMYVPERNPVAAFIGDSYTAGAGSQEGGFVRLVAADQKWTARNLGRGGTGFTTEPDQDPDVAQLACSQDYCESYPEMIPAAAATSPDIVVVSGGRNSVGRDPEELRTAIEFFFEELRAALPEARIIVTSPVWDDEPAPDALSDIARSEADAAASIGAEYIEIGQPLEGKPELLSGDGIHPNDEGHAALASAILAGLAG